MQISDGEYQTSLAVAQNITISSQIDGYGTCPVCNQHFPELLLEPFTQHCHHCKSDLSQRVVSHFPPDRHKSKNHPFSKKRHLCPFCSKAFEASNLKVHLRIHTGERPFECKQCNKCFVRKSHLATHLRIHTGEKIFECKQCDKSFVQKANLQRHQRTHTGEKPFECKLCSKAFAYGNSLKLHMQKHQEKPLPSGDSAFV